MNDYLVVLFNESKYTVQAESDTVLMYFGIPCAVFHNSDGDTVAYFPLSTVLGVMKKDFFEEVTSD